MDRVSNSVILTSALKCFQYKWCSTKNFETQSCTEKKGVLSHMLARSWGVQSKQSAAGLDGEDGQVHCPGVAKAFLYSEFGEQRFKLFWKN